jgi:hypothetical protein
LHIRHRVPMHVAPLAQSESWVQDVMHPWVPQPYAPQLPGVQTHPAPYMQVRPDSQPEAAVQVVAQTFPRQANPWQLPGTAGSHATTAHWEFEQRAPVLQSASLEQ